jgi:hypothetical protein
LVPPTSLHADYLLTFRLSSGCVIRLNRYGPASNPSRFTPLPTLVAKEEASGRGRCSLDTPHINLSGSASHHQKDSGLGLEQSFYTCTLAHSHTYTYTHTHIHTYTLSLSAPNNPASARQLSDILESAAPRVGGMHYHPWKLSGRAYSLSLAD